MADYRVSVGQRTYDVTIRNDMLLVNGTPQKINMESLNGNGLHILRQPTRNVETYLQTNRNGSYDVQIEGNHLNAEVVLGYQKQDKKELSAAGKLFSPMPGIIVDIPVKSGDKVQKGDTILVQEAMKMQMKIRTSSTGTITRINTAPGRQVEKGELLVTIKPDEDHDLKA
jgi:biotin carboxyl carrier protein